MKNQGIVWCAAVVSMFAQSCWGYSGENGGKEKRTGFVDVISNLEFSYKEGGRDPAKNVGIEDLNGIDFKYLTQSSLKALLSEMVADRETLEAVISLRTKGVAEALRRIQWYEKKVEEISVTLKGTKKDLDKISKELEAEKGDKERLLKELDGLKTKLADLQKEKAETESKLKEENEALKNQVDALQKELAEAKGGLDNLAKEKEDLSAKVDKKKAKSQELKALATEYKDRYQELLNIVELLVKNETKISQQVADGFSDLCDVLDVDNAELKDPTKTKEIHKKIAERVSSNNRAIEAARRQLKKVSEEALKTKEELKEAMELAIKGESKKKRKGLNETSSGGREEAR